MTKKKTTSGTARPRRRILFVRPPDNVQRVALRRVARRWRWVLVALVLLFLFRLVDRNVKTPGVLGYFPDDARWVASSRDFPAFWAGVNDSDLRARLPQEAAQPLHEIGLRFRKWTGLRPTPGRWRLWLGPYLVASWSPDHGTGASLRPGLLLRAAAKPLGLGESAERLVLYRSGLYYGWRDGYLILSQRSEYVEAALAQNAGVLRAEALGEGGRLRLRSRAKPQWTLTIAGENGLPAQGWIERSFMTEGPPLTLPHAWPAGPVMVVSGRDAQDTVDWVRNLLDQLPAAEIINTGLRDVEAQLPLEWTEDHEFSLALTSVDLAQPLAVPEVALVQRVVGGATLPEPTPPSMPFAWPVPPHEDLAQANGANADSRPAPEMAEGWLRPVLGPDFTLSVAVTGDDRYFTSREAAMSEYLGRVGPGVKLPVDLTLFVDWSQFLPVYESLLVRAAAYELLPRSSSDDIENIFLPYTVLLHNLGRLYIEGIAQDSRTLLNGFLAENFSGPGDNAGNASNAR